MATIEFQIKNIKDRSGMTATVAAIDGSIDATSIQKFQSVMDKLVERNVKNLILDCARVSYINSTGLGTLLKYADQFDSFGGHMAFIRVPNKVLLVMEMLGFNALFNIVKDENEALALFSGRNVQEAPSTPATPAPPAAPPAPAAPAMPPAAPAAPTAVAPASARVASEPPAPQEETFPLTTHCLKCRVKLKIDKPGQYKCPRCGAILKVEETGKVRFYTAKKQKPEELVLPCDEEIAVGAGEMAAYCARAANVNGVVADQIADAVTEACLNVIERALENRKNEIYHMMISTTRQGLIIRIADSGKTIQFDGGDIRQDEGFGAVVDRMDTVEHTDNGGIGNIITLTRKF